MNDADIELIISLANDELNGQEQIDALARVNADPALASELATQISTIDAVQSLPGVEMTASERSTLHANLVEQLHLAEALPVVVPVKRKVSWWQPAIGFASVAAVVFAIAVVPNMLSSSTSDDAAFSELSTDASQEFDAPGGSEAGGSEATTTAAASADTSIVDDAAGEQAPLADLADDGANDLQLFRIPLDRQEEFNDLASGETSSDLLSEKLARYGFALGTTIDPEELQDCLYLLAEQLPNGLPLPIGDGDANTVYVGIDTGDGIDTIFEIDLATCTIVSQAP